MLQSIVSEYQIQKSKSQLNAKILNPNAEYLTFGLVQKDSFGEFGILALASDILLPIQIYLSKSI